MGCTNSTPASSVSRKVFSQKYDLGEKLCNGAFGQVYACQRRSSFATDTEHVESAVKVIDIAGLQPLRDFQKEESIWRMLCGDIVHPNCVRLIGSWCEGHSAYMVMERCQRSLQDYVEELGGAAFPNLARTTQDMLMAVEHVHRMGIIHRDIKLDNFLQSWDHCSVKLCDFGMAIDMPKKGLLKEECGTPSYMAPEVLRGTGYDQKVDMWSLGVVAYVLAFGELPYKPGYHGVKECIMYGHDKPTFRGLHRTTEILEVGKLVRTLLDRSPETRFCAEDALQLLADFVQVGMDNKDSDKIDSRASTKASTCDGGESISTYDGGGYDSEASPSGESFCTFSTFVETTL